MSLLAVCPQVWLLVKQEYPIEYRSGGYSFQQAATVTRLDSETASFSRRNKSSWDSERKHRISLN